MLCLGPSGITPIDISIDSTYVYGAQAARFPLLRRLGVPYDSVCVTWPQAGSSAASDTRLLSRTRSVTIVHASLLSDFDVKKSDFDVKKKYFRLSISSG